MAEKHTPSQQPEQQPIDRGEQRTVRGWTLRQARLRSSRAPEVEAVVTDPAARLIDLDETVWPDTAVDPATVPAVMRVVAHAEACRADRAIHGPEHLSAACHRVRPVLRVLRGGGELERREDAG